VVNEPPVTDAISGTGQSQALHDREGFCTLCGTKTFAIMERNFRKRDRTVVREQGTAPVGQGK
jgi:hypothetical protein